MDTPADRKLYRALEQRDDARAALTESEAEVRRLREFVSEVAKEFDPQYEPEGGYDEHGSPMTLEGGFYTVMDFSHGEDYAEFMAGMQANRLASRARALLDGGR